MRRSSPSTATTTAADQVRRQSEYKDNSYRQECLRRSLDDSLRPFQRQQETTGFESQPVLRKCRHDKRQRATALNHAAVACRATGSRSITNAGGQQESLFATVHGQ